MTDSLNNIRNSFQIKAPNEVRKDLTLSKTQIQPKKSFEQVLNESIGSPARTGSVKFSKHASDRLISRNIDLSDGLLTRLEDGVSKASSKGINESLVMVDDVAFIVNIRNNTVITAVSDMDEQVFTNIDGAVIA
ncbi:MAG: flagellar protein [Lachnospiraceae bacterium]|nr:flagellar protein [Lachnospiraceae bacterium]